MFVIVFRLMAWHIQFSIIITVDQPFTSSAPRKAGWSRWQYYNNHPVEMLFNSKAFIDCLFRRSQDSAS